MRSKDWRLAFILYGTIMHTHFEMSLFTPVHDSLFLKIREGFQFPNFQNWRKTAINLSAKRYPLLKGFALEQFFQFREYRIALSLD
jgi:hypothetical protein